MVATLILVRDDRGNLHDQEGHLRNAADVNFISGTGFQGSWNQGGNKNSYGNRVVKEEKLQEGDFEVESLMSFGGSHWRRPTPSHEHRSTEVIQNRSTSSPGHRSTTPMESDLEISDDFGAFWRYLEQAPEMTIELDNRSILEEEYRSMFTLEHRSTAKRAESPFGHSQLEAQVFTNL
ncbi:hypothetical protein F2Q68_00040068 [Brassica cretica]|uniref:Uncharacterized protein n=1 Tax=Brassica cretica TaxID=69181 RepID=A0A8S9MHP1_BRACR|nr:hypothetical protein F2Q68_00040068 [Brassica cretica]